MKKDIIKNKLDILESKLNAILLQAAPPAPAPYTLHNWLAEWFAIYKPPTLSKKWRDNLRRAIDRIKANTPDRLFLVCQAKDIGGVNVKHRAEVGERVQSGHRTPRKVLPYYLLTYS